MSDEDLTVRIRRLVLAWSVKSAPSLASAREALQRTGFVGEPDEMLGPYPDLLSWGSGGLVGHRLPMTESDFHERIVEDPAALVDELLTFEGRDFSVDGPSWFDVLVLVERAVTENPDDGLLLVSLPQLNPRLLGAVLNGWSSAEIDNTQVEPIVEALDGIDLSEVAREVAHLLADGSDGNAKSSVWHGSEGARRLSLKLWSGLETELPDAPERWLEVAVQSTAGTIALYWTHAISADWSDDPSRWDGLSEAAKAALDLMLDEGLSRSVMAQVILVSQLDFYFRADRDWTVAKLLPFLDWAEPDQAQRSWDAFLFWGRWQDNLLDAGLFDMYMGVVDRWGLVSASTRERMCVHLAGIAIYSSRNPLSWLDAFVNRASANDLADWAREVRTILQQVSNETVENEWHRWMSRYWTNRLRSMPRPLDPAESSEMAIWSLFLSESTESAVGLALEAPLGTGEHNDLLWLLDDDRFDRAPSAFVRLLSHALESKSQPFYGQHNLRGILTRARAHVPSEDLTPLVDQALRLGLTDIALT